jgi:hypothetical protein
VGTNSDPIARTNDTWAHNLGGISAAAGDGSIDAPLDEREVLFSSTGVRAVARLAKKSPMPSAGGKKNRALIGRILFLSGSSAAPASCRPFC